MERAGPTEWSCRYHGNIHTLHLATLLRRNRDSRGQNLEGNGKEVYETAAAEYGRKLLDCQEKESSRQGCAASSTGMRPISDIVH